MNGMDVVKTALNERRMSVEQGRMIVCDRCEWRSVSGECTSNDATTGRGSSPTSGVIQRSDQVQEERETVSHVKWQR